MNGTQVLFDPYCTSSPYKFGYISDSDKKRDGKFALLVGSSGFPVGFANGHSRYLDPLAKEN